MSASVVRVDPYNITVNGHRVPANEYQEESIRAMDDDAIERLLKLLGRIE